MDAKTTENKLKEDELYLKLKGYGGIESLLYVSFFEGKNQNDGFKMISSSKDEKRMNQNKLIKIKNDLISVDYIKKSYYGTGVKRLFLKSTPKPFIRYIKEILSERRSDSKSANADKEYNVLKNEEDALFPILNSKWFRHSVYNFIDNRRVDKQSLNDANIAGSAMQCLGKTFDELAAIVRALGESNLICSNMPTIEQVTDSTNFDNFSKIWIKKHFHNDKFNNFVIDAIEAGCNTHPENNKHTKFFSTGINESNKVYNRKAKDRLFECADGLYLLCIPYELAKKFCNTIRWESTIEGGVIRGMNINAEKKKYKEFLNS